MNYNENDARADIDRISSETELYDRMIQVAAIITKLMEGHVKVSDLPIIVGGLSMEIYTESKYTTHDIDFVTSASKEMEEKLLAIGFENSERVFQHKYLNVAVDIVDSVLEPPDYDGLIKLEVDNDKYIYVQSIESILYDRVLDYERVDNEQYSVYLISIAYDEIDFDYLKREVKTADPDALIALEKWIEKALEN
ncbi:hypothetical protein ACBR55_10620 [Salinicoccus roseus]|uniref:hypothetical protein n=1 Tax=Salinicoccus roseus TaxID=45670 RepID=UPI002301089A|nr:hypothetical protein [Salinicoccus roseus]